MLTYQNANENGYTINIAFEDRWGYCFGLYNPQNKFVVWEDGKLDIDVPSFMIEQFRDFYLSLEATQEADATDATNENEHLIRIVCLGFIGFYNPSTKTALFEDGEKEYIGSFKTRSFKTMRAAYIETEEDCWAEFDQRMKPVTE